jgi:hypothetical protein
MALGVCTACAEDCVEGDGTCQYAGSGCTPCVSSLCIACTSSAADACTACQDNATETDGVCTCDNAFYDDTTNNCQSCPTGCSLCTDGVVYKCQECGGTSNLQPDDVDICIVPCPYGSTPDTNVCGAVEAEAVFTFD